MDWMSDVVERAAEGPVLRDRRSTPEMACRFRGLRRISCIWLYVCVAWAAFGGCLNGLDVVVERAAGGPVLRDRRSTPEMACKFPGKRSISCLWMYLCVAWAAFRSWVYVCVAWAAFGSCLKGLDLVERVAGGLALRDRRSALEMACIFRGPLLTHSRTHSLPHSPSLTFTHTHSHSLTFTHTDSLSLTH